MDELNEFENTGEEGVQVDEGFNMDPDKDNIDTDFGKEPEVDSDFNVNPDNRPDIIDPEFGVEGEIDPDFSVEQVQEEDPLEEFLESINDFKNVTSTIGVEKDFAKVEELKDKLNIGCKGNDAIIDRLMSNIEGYKLICNYFNLRNDRHDGVMNASESISGSAQAYDLIKNAVLYLSSPIDSYDLKDVGFECLINLSIVPYKEDLIMFTTSSNKLVVFRVKEIERVNYNNKEIHKLTLNYYYNDITNKKNIEDILSKVVDTYTYDYENGYIGNNTLLKTEDYENKINLETELKRMKELYIATFKCNETNSLNLYNGSLYLREGKHTFNYVLFDRLVTNFFISLCDFEDNDLINRLHSNDYSMEYEPMHIFKALRETLPMKPTMIEKSFGISNSKIKPVDAFHLDISNVFRYNKFLIDYKHDLEYENYPEMNLLLYRRNDDNQLVFPLINKKLEDTSYILSETFYNGNEKEMNVFEKLITKVLRKEDYNFKELVVFVESYRYWSRYELFYCLPILMSLIIKFIRKL